MGSGRHRWAKVGAMPAVAVLVLVGCLEREQYPVEPRIAYKSLVQFPDSASLTIAFTDGDGDIGLRSTDTQPPFDTGSYYYHNLFLEYEELRNGEWVRPPLAIPYRYRVPYITPAGQNKTLEGEISVALKPWPIAAPPFDTVRFGVMLVDRALHESNVVFTEAVKTGN